jgi:hypothetical protein
MFQWLRDLHSIAESLRVIAADTRQRQGSSELLGYDPPNREDMGAAAYGHRHKDGTTTVDRVELFEYDSERHYALEQKDEGLKP